jgi:hypothetical protein
MRSHKDRRPHEKSPSANHATGFFFKQEERPCLARYCAIMRNFAPFFGRFWPFFSFT